MLPGAAPPGNPTSQANRPPPIEIRLFGEFQVACGDHFIAEEDWRLRKAAHLVKLLALEPGNTLHREQAIDLLWPDRNPEAGGRNLRYALHVARRVLAMLAGAPAECLRFQDERLFLCPDSDLWIDVRAFETVSAAALRSPNPASIAAAVDLYAGDLLPSDRYEDWASGHRERLRETYLTLLLELAALHESSGAMLDSVTALQRVVAAEPTHEAAHVHLMKVYASTGQRHQALRQFEQLRTALRNDLNIDPEPASRRLVAEIEAGRFPGDQPLIAGNRRQQTEQAHATNLPVSLTTFVGRRRDLAQVRDLLSSTRLVTISGPGGSGKTRLATEIGAMLTGAFADGVWLVELSPVADSSLLATSVATTLSVPEASSEPLTGSIAETLRSREILLILDNCEHVAAECARLVKHLLGACSHLRVLATSREPLHVPGETVWRIGPLDLPDPNQPWSLERLERNEAVQLFIERTRLVRPGFIPTMSDARTILEICLRLDGLPLAIELAAARLASLSLDQLLARIDDSLRLLASPGQSLEQRQRTMQATLDWSYGLLTNAERLVWARLSVFAGSWSLDGAEAVAYGGGIHASEIFDLIARLVDKSMVAVDLSSGETRYRLLEVLRQYAWLRLVEDQGVEDTRQRHAAYYLQLAEAAESELRGPRQAEWYERLEHGHDNLRAALRWSIEHEDVEHGLRLAGALAHFWLARGHYHEGCAWLVAALDRAATNAPRKIRAKALAGALLLAYRQGDFRAAQAFGEEHLELQRAGGDRRAVAWSLIHLSMAVGELGDIDGSARMLEEGLAVSREIGDAAGVSRALNSLGEIARIRDAPDRAAMLYEESLANWRALGDRQYIAMALHNLAYACLALGDLQDAATHFRESLRLYRDLENPDGIAAGLTGLASVAAAEQPQTALQLFAAADALRSKIGSPEDAADRLQSQRYEALARVGLDAQAAASAWSTGALLPFNDAIEAALAIAIPTRTPRADATGSDRLSQRELEVAERIVSGATNTEIAAALDISPRTVDKHVSNILRKLGLASRAEVASRLEISGPPPHGPRKAP